MLGQGFFGAMKWWDGSTTCGGGTKVEKVQQVKMKTKCNTWRWCRCKSTHGEVYWKSRLSAAFRTGLACLMVGVILHVGSTHVQWVTFPIFGYVIAVTVAGESTVGKAMQDALAIALGTIQGVGMNLAMLQILPPARSFRNIGVSIACISISAFFIVLPKATPTTNILHKRIMLAHSAIIYITALVQREHMDKVFFPLRLASTTIVGATCGMLALLPFPHLAIFQVQSQTKLSAQISSERLKVLVDAFCAIDTMRASAFNLQAKALAKIASSVDSDITAIEDLMRWETKRFPWRTSHNLQHVTRGLTPLRKALVGLDLALQADLASSVLPTKQRGLIGSTMRDSLIYVTDWVCLPTLQHASTEIKQHSPASHAYRQVIIEKGNEVLSSFNKALYNTRQQVGHLLATEEFHLNNYKMDSIRGNVASHSTGNADIPINHGFRSVYGSRLNTSTTDHMREPTFDDLQLGSSLLPLTMGALLGSRDQAAASFFLFNVKKFVQGTKHILESLIPKASLEALEQSKVVQIQVLAPTSDSQNPPCQKASHIKVLSHYCPTSEINSQPATGHEKPPPRKPASAQNAPCSQNRPVQKFCSKCIARSSSAKSKVRGQNTAIRLLAAFKFLKPHPQQLRTAFKLSLAMAIGGIMGFWFNNRKGYWADITLALGFTGAAKGGSFKVAVLRTLGTVSGTIYGLVVVLATFNFPMLRLVALIPWVVFTSFLRQSKIFGYAGAVSAFTGAIVILARTNKDSSDQEFTVIRIVEAFLGMASFLIVEMLVLPHRAASMVKPDIISGLGKLQEFVSAIFEVYSSEHCGECRGSKAIEDLKRKEEKLRKVITSQNKLVKEAAEEPQFWFAPFPENIFSKIMEEQGNIMEMLHFSIAILEEIKQVAEDTKVPMDRLLQAPLKEAMTIMEEKVVQTLAFLAKVLAVEARQVVPVQDGSHTLHVSKLAATTKSSIDQGHKFVEREVLMMSKAIARNSSVFEHCQVTDEGVGPLMNAFEKGALHMAYELVVLEASGSCQIGNSSSSATNSTQYFGSSASSNTFSNTLFLSLGTLAFAMNGLLHHTIQLENVIHELIQEENPWALIDFSDASKPMGHL